MQRLVNNKPVIAIALALAIAAPWILPNYYLHVLITAGLFVMLSSGLNLIHGYVGRLSLGHTAFYGLGGYTAALLASKLGLGLLFTIPAAVAVCIAAGLALGHITLRFRGAQFVLVTLAFAAILQLFANNLVDITGGPMGLSGVVSPVLHQGWGDFHLFGSKASFYWLTLALAIVSVYVVWRVVNSPVGAAMVAIREDEFLAQAVGINEYRYSMLAFVLGAAIAGIAGAVYAHYVSFVSPEIFGFHIMIMILVMVIIGSVGTVTGPVIGSLLVVILLEVLRLHESLREPIFGAVLVGAILLFPQGLVLLIGKRLGCDHRAGHPVVAAATADWTAATSTIADNSIKTAAPVAGLNEVRLAALPSARSRTGATPAGPLLRVKDLSVRFGGLVAVDNVSFEVQRGQIVSLIGPNGAGKTTTLNLLTSFIARSSGYIVFDGAELPRQMLPSQIAGMGIIRTFQTTRGLQSMTIGDAVMTGFHRTLNMNWGRIARAAFLGLPDMGLEARAAACLRQVGLARDVGELTANLSYGEQRLLEVAIALAAEPELLVLDEPVAGMNPEETARMIALIKRLRNSGITILLVEHDMKMVMSLSDHIVVLDHGKLIAEGEPVAIQKNPSVIEAYLGRGAANVAA